MKSIYRLLLSMLACLYSCSIFGQKPALPNVIPSLPTAKIPNYLNQDYAILNAQQRSLKINGKPTDKELSLQAMQEAKIDIEELSSPIKYDLPSLSTFPETVFYREAFDKIASMDTVNYSIKDINFLIENAYFGNRQNAIEFNKIVKQSGAFLRAKMKELKYDESSNLAKNYILFRFFSEKMQLKATGQQHLPFKYDFEDYSGARDWSKMFVSKLIATGRGQCHSLPQLYLILAEEIGAKAFLALSPNHSYIKFQDEKKKWYNLELTNGMFTTNSFILNSGFIKAEAMQNKIYMQPLSNKQLLAEYYTDLAAGYIHKFGYDGFVEECIGKALKLYPDNINANMILANYNTVHFGYVMKQLHIDPTDKEQLQKINKYPNAVALLVTTNKQYQKVDDLGYEFMPADAYQKWLGSLKEASNRQQNENFGKQFKEMLIRKPKN